MYGIYFPEWMAFLSGFLWGLAVESYLWNARIKREWRLGGNNEMNKKLDGLSKNDKMKIKNTNLIWNNHFVVLLIMGFAIFLFIDIIYGNNFTYFLASILLGMILMIILLRYMEEKR